MFGFDPLMMGAGPSVPGPPTQYSTTSATLSSFTVPADGEVEFYLWGAAGGGSGWGTTPGGPGGYAYGKFKVQAGQVIKYGAGQGGTGGGNGNGPSLGGTGAGGFGNGGVSGTGTDGYNHGGGGGGATVGLIDNAFKTIAGAGGGTGGEPGYRGGSGGGLSGGNGTGSSTGGTQTGPGGNASGMNGGAGGNTREAGGGGGGGYYGGGGGNGSWTGSGGTGSGGGSGYVAADCLASDLQTAALQATQPPNTASPYYSGSAGVPSYANSVSNPGLAVIVYRPYI
ncbi:glycine-rich protein [Azospirillum melinis]